MKIYLDIDDTLINTDMYNMRPANHLKEFLEFVYQLDLMIVEIKPTSWNVLKTDAINMNEDFLWFDDTLSWGEENALKDNSKLNSHVKVNLDDKPNFLLDFIEKKI